MYKKSRITICSAAKNVQNLLLNQPKIRVEKDHQMQMENKKFLKILKSNPIKF